MTTLPDLDTGSMETEKTNHSLSCLADDFVQMDADVHRTEINQLQSCIGVRIEQPSFVLPICQENTNSAGCRFWTGNDRDKKLLASHLFVLVEVQHPSRLVFDGSSQENTSENEHVLEENLKILVPMDVAVKVGCTKLAQVGPVMERTPMHTFVLRKVSCAEECNADETVLYYENEIFGIETQPHGNGAELENEFEEVHGDKFTWSMLPKILEGSAAKLLSQKGLVITALICRIGVCGLRYYYNVFKNNSGTRLMSDEQSTWNVDILDTFYMNDLVGIAQKLYQRTSVFIMKFGNLL